MLLTMMGLIETRDNNGKRPMEGKKEGREDRWQGEDADMGSFGKLQHYCSQKSAKRGYSTSDSAPARFTGR